MALSQDVEDIEAIFQQPAGSLHASTDGAADGTDEKENWRAAKLNELARILQAKERAQEVETLVDYTQRIADGSRNATWRPAIGRSGMLEFALELLERQDTPNALKIQNLRLIGNCCADTDENRQRIIQHSQLRPIISLLADDDLLPVVIPVLYNISVDYEPAQLQASQAGLSFALINIITSERLQHCRPVLGIVSDILALLVTQEQERAIANPKTPKLLLGMIIHNQLMPDDLQVFCGLASVALAYLHDGKFQAVLLDDNGFDTLKDTFSNASSYLRGDVNAFDDNELPPLKELMPAFVQAIADVSALPSFALRYPINSSVVSSLVYWLEDPLMSDHQRTATCLALGNLARSDEASIALAKIVYPTLFTRLSTAISTKPPVLPPSQLLHAMLSFLKNLAIPPSNKVLLGPLLAGVLPGLWSATTTQPQAQFAAVSLTRLLLSGCPDNARLVCAQTTSSSGATTTHLASLLAIAASADAEPTKLEAARTAAAVCRLLHTPREGLAEPILDGEWAAADGDDERRVAFHAFHAPALPIALAALAAAQRFATLRSESWFVLALMSRSADGARAALQALLADEGKACDALAEAVRGPSGQNNETESAVVRSAEVDAAEELGLEPRAAVDPGQAANMVKADRENGLVLLSGILKNGSEGLPEDKKKLFEDLLAKGGELIVTERKHG